MRQGWLWMMSLAAVVSGAACSGESTHGSGKPTDILVLDVGGAQPSLRAALVAKGITVPPGHQLTMNSGGRLANAGSTGARQLGAAEDLADVLGESESSAEQAPQAVPSSDPDLSSESEWVMVALREDETLTHVSRRCLGSGHRFREIMEWNGFSERDTRTMRIGTAIKIKRSEMR